MENSSIPDKPKKKCLNDRILDGLAESIRQRKEPGSLWHKVGFLCKLLIYAINGAFLFGLFFAMFGMNVIGERNLAFAILLYAPVWFWLIPFGFFVPLCLVTLRWKLLLLHLLVIAGFILVYMDFEWRWWTPSLPDDALVILTNNRGQHQNQSLQPFIRQHEPHFICLQEARSRASRYENAEGYEGYEARNMGEFLLLSRFPILETGMIQTPRLKTGRMSNYAAWFTVDWNGREIVIYQVHTLTPREQLSADLRPIALGLLALPPFSPARGRHDARMDYWHQRIAEMEHFTEILAAEERPYLVVGDFNMVDRGHLYNLLKPHLQDTHEKAGRGYGYTFPGTGGGLPTFYEPWLRIDYVFTGPGWKVHYSEAEPDRPSQHRAVAAAVSLRE